jgi:glutamine synthetase
MSFFSPEAIAERTQQTESVRENLRRQGHRFAQMEIPDNNGQLRGKIVGLEKGLGPSGTGVSTLLVSVKSGDQLAMTPFSNFENGFPKMVAVPDPTTVQHLPWRNGVAGVLCDLYMEDGSPCPLHVRHLLRQAEEQYRLLGLEPKIALEYEFYVFEEDDARMRERRYSELKSFGRGWDFYSITRFPGFERLAEEFMVRCAAVGIEVEAFHTELGHGMFEYTFAPQSPLKAADDAVRAKLYLRQLCAEMHLVPSFMASLHVGTGDSSSGCHHNFSIAKGKHNAFWDPEKRALSPLARHVAAGVLETMPAFNIIYRPWVNSFRRMDRLLWNPENASWGLDNHTVGIRVAHGSVPEKYTRFEHRAPGADVNPYLSVLSLLLGGLRGLRSKRDPGDYALGDAMLDKRWPLLPHTMPESIAAFRSSPLAVEAFGPQFVEHYAAVKADEWKDFAESGGASDDRPTAAHITEWELQRYFLHV